MGILERISFSRRLIARKKESMISDYLDSRLVAFLDVETCEEAIDALIERLDRIGKLADRDAFRKAIFDREKLVSTGIGLGVALPHAPEGESENQHEKYGEDQDEEKSLSVPYRFL